MAPFQHGTNCNATSSSKFVFIGFEAAEKRFVSLSIILGRVDLVFYIFGRRFRPTLDHVLADTLVDFFLILVGIDKSV